MNKCLDSSALTNCHVRIKNCLGGIMKQKGKLVLITQMIVLQSLTSAGFNV